MCQRKSSGLPSMKGRSPLREIKEIPLRKQTKEDQMKRASACQTDKRIQLSVEWKWRKTMPPVRHLHLSIPLLIVLSLLNGGEWDRQGVSMVEGYSSTYNAKDFSRNVTQLIDGLLDKRWYDKNIRPGFGGESYQYFYHFFTGR